MASMGDAAIVKTLDRDIYRIGMICAVTGNGQPTRIEFGLGLSATSPFIKDQVVVCGNSSYDVAALLESGSGRLFMSLDEAKKLVGEFGR
ncbi:MAG: hypothetical protein ACRDGM_18125 [bacterium]